MRTDRGLKRLPVNKGIHPQRYPRESPTKREWIKAPQEKQFLYRKELRGRFQTRIGGKHKKIQVTAKELEDAGDAEARVVKKLGVADQTSESDKALIKPANINEKQLQHTLKFLVDPTKLQEHTQRLLQKGDVPQAYAILQYASKSRDCVVSWNALVNWCLNEGRLNAALKIYNEVLSMSELGIQ